jgi:hypothetical protein
MSVSTASAGGASNTRLLVSNTAPLFVHSGSVPVAYLPYESHDQLSNLRRKHNSTHLFRRVENRIQIVRLDGGETDIGEDGNVAVLADNLGLVATLARNALIEQYFQRKCEILDFRPIEVVSTSTQQNFLTTALPNERIPAWLSIRQLCEIDVRVFSDSGRAFLGIVLNLRMRRRLLCACDELLNIGVDLCGLKVVVLKPGSDPRVQPLRQPVGRVLKVLGDALQVNGANGELTEIPAKEGRLNLGPQAFRRVLNALFGTRAESILIKLDTALASLSQGQVRLEKLKSVLADLQRQKLRILPNVELEVGKFLSEADKSFPSIAKLGGPTYVFDPAGRKTDSVKPRGLDKYGPYTAQVFSPSQPRVCVLCEASCKGDVEQFIYKFLNGVNAARLRYPPHAKGFCRAYHLSEIKPEFFIAKGPSAQAFHKAAQEALDAQSDSTARWALALVQSREATHQMLAQDNPYLICKAAFHSQQIPVQEFEAETMHLATGNLEYALSNMALASYAKLGGVPWLLKADPTIAHEFVVGLGSSYIIDDSAGTRERVVGITTVFSGDGNYMLSNLSRAVPSEEFQSALLECLRSSFEQARSKLNWQPGELVRLVFHSFKPMKDAEAEAVLALADELKEYTLEFAFIHVVDDHPHLLFDTCQRGAWDAVSRASKGKFVPERGFYQKFSARDALVTLTGPKELKQVDDGMPFPILLRLHRDSTFTDLDYLARQVFHFSDHSWRTFLPASMPVTISYSQLIARMLGNLARLPRWDPDTMRGRLGRSRWFL